MPVEFRAGACCSDVVNVVVADATRGHSSAGQSIGLRCRVSTAERSQSTRSRAVKLTAEKVVEIRKLRAAGALSDDIAARFGVSQSLVCQIATGRLWADSSGPITRVYRPSGETLAERLAAQTDSSSGPGSCWPFTGRRDADGYGRMYFAGNTIGAHVAALEIKLGRVLEEGEVARHTCDYPPCANPDHLIPGSIADNNRDCQLRGRRPAKLSPEQVIAIRAAAPGMGWGGLAQLAKRYGVSQQHIGRIVRGVKRAGLPASAAIAPAVAS